MLGEGREAGCQMSQGVGVLEMLQHGRGAEPHLQCRIGIAQQTDQGLGLLRIAIDQTDRLRDLAGLEQLREIRRHALDAPAAGRPFGEFRR